MPGPLSAGDVLASAGALDPNLVYALTGRCFEPTIGAGEDRGSRSPGLTADARLSRVLDRCLQSHRRVALGPLVSMLWHEIDPCPRVYSSLRESIERARHGLWQLRARGDHMSRMAAHVARHERRHVEAAHRRGLQELRDLPAFLAAAVVDRAEPLHLAIVEAAVLAETDLGEARAVRLGSVAALVEGPQHLRFAARLCRCAARLCADGVLRVLGDDPETRLGSEIQLTWAAAEDLYAALANDRFDDGDRERWQAELDS